jgi:hypothetical protein
MVRISVTLAALALYASLALPVAAQQYSPPPEGAPVQGNPYGQPPGANPAAKPIPDAVMLTQAKKVFAQLQTGKVDRSELSTSTPNSNMNDATIANAQRMIGSLGKPVSFVEQRSTSQGSMTGVLYLVTFQNGQKIDFLYMVDSQGKVTGLGLGTPH